MAQLLRHKPYLDRLFFDSNSSIFQRGSDAYKDFWCFCEKYISFQKRKDRQGLSSGSRGAKVSQYDWKDISNTFHFPSHYEKIYKVNIDLNMNDIYEKWNIMKEKVQRESKKKGFHSGDSGRDEQRETERELPTKEDLKEFKNIILYYIDFCQKQKFSKLKKLRQDQENLPIFAYKDQIIYALKLNQIVIIAGDTGCGKSTQVPQYLLSAGFSNIACTQPRRIACISLAKRVGFETLNEYGSEVGYQVRFDSSRTESTKIVFLTEGLLLRQFQSDPKLLRYNVIVVDEVHERHLNGDFLLGVLRCLLEQRPDLKLILMSATINISLFANYFHGSPVLQIPGRLFPIELQYVPHFVEVVERTGRRERLDPSPYLRVMQLIDHKYPSSERGDLLIFMSGMSEIAVVVEAAREYAEKTQKWIILPLHSALSIEEQEKVFDIAPANVRKCIVSTNIAETSITIDGVRFICDSGKVKEMSFDAYVRMQRLQEFWISRASAEQRKGRAGRTGPGVCFRLYSEEDYQAFSEYSTPEIQRVPLDNLVLQMSSLGLQDPSLFPFIEPPPRSSIEDSIYSLRAQRALLEDNTLSTIGKVLARLPVDVVIGKMLVMGTLFDLVDAVVVIASALSVPSPLSRKLGAQSDADVERRRSELDSEHGDPLTLLNMYDEWLNVKADRKSSSRKWCKRRGFEEQRFYEMSKLKEQFEDLLRDHALLKYEKMAGDRMRRVERDRDSAREKERLRELKRSYRQVPRKRKVLKLGSGSIEETPENDLIDTHSDDEIDIHDIEFKLKHDISKLKEKSSRLRELTVKDMNLLKLVIASGFFPQVAVPDESNSWRRQSDQVYHSKNKQFLLLHPASVYSTNPRLLESQSTFRDGGDQMKEGKEQYIDSEEIFVYVSLLETNKPYIVNPMRVPALQTLLLLSHSLDTNSACTRILCDEWLEIGLDSEEEGQDLLGKVVQLREGINKLLELKLSFLENINMELSVVLRKTKTLQHKLSSKLANFMSTSIKYMFRRILSSESQYIYAGPGKNLETRTLAFSEDDESGCSSPNRELVKPNFVPLNEGIVHPSKGGIRVNDYLTYGCLRDSTSVAVAAGEAEYLRQHYHCSRCGVHLICTVIEKIQHMNSCHNEDLEGEEKNSPGHQGSSVRQDQNSSTANTNNGQLAEVSKLANLRKDFLCDTCKRNFKFTASEKLKHILHHRKETSGDV